MTDLTESDHIRSRAIATARARRWLLLHAIVYLAVNGVRVIVDVVDGDGFRSHWVILGWGIGLAAHAFVVLSPISIFGGWERRQAEQIEQRLRAQSDGVR